ncbi:MAG: hypothetical protein MUC69_06285 [Gemmatimonadales bacterium]|jgi:uncharacterized protein (DUF1697 family)|nr:hypothetical protein [Gemmatimonadales bacterium]
MALVVLLRGVNVGGHRRFRPALLAKALVHLKVQSIGAAGTFVVGVRTTQAALRREFAGQLPFPTEIVTCRGGDIARVLASDALRPVGAGTGVVRFVSVLARRARTAPALPLVLPRRGRWSLRLIARDGRIVVGDYRREMRAIRYLGQLDQVFGVPVTTRSWSTMMTVGRALALPVAPEIAS